MKKQYTPLVLVLLAVLLTSCHPGYEVEVTNNSGKDLIVLSLDGDLKATSYPIGSDQAVRVEVWYKLQVQHSGGIWNYDMPAKPLPKNYGKRIGVNRYLHRYQIEKDGTINVLLPDSQAPVANPPSQPDGYPVRPK